MKNNQTYIIGITWFILSLVISLLNDVAGKYMSNNLPSIQISFLRFLFGMLSLLPFMLYYGKKSFYTPRVFMHFARGAILFFAIVLWIYQLKVVPLVVATLTTFVIPLFVLIMAPIFLKETISLPLIIATITGFIASIIILQPNVGDFNPSSLLMLLSAFLFSTLDIINKKFVVKESMLSMLFYSALVTTMLAVYPAYLNWHPLSTLDTMVCLYLGVGSNAILFCLLKAFTYVPASSVAPYRYLELLFSLSLGVLLFSEIPTLTICIGAAIIIISTSFIAYKQIQPQVENN